MTSPAVSLRDPIAADKAARALSALLDLSKDVGPDFDLPKLLEVIAEKARQTGESDLVVSALEQYDRSLRLAGEIQMRMLPGGTVAMPEGSPFAIRAFIRPAKQIGGDLYDFFWNDESLSFSIGDVTGKGVGAALVMAMTKTLLRAYSVFQYDPARLMSAVSARLSEETDPSMFVTAFCGLLDLRTGRLLYSNAGHEPPIVVRGGKPVERLTSRAGIPLGALRSFKYVVDTRMLEPGDIILLFTDGVTEATNRRGELFTAQRLRDVVERCGAADPTSMVTDIVVAVDQFAEGMPQSDDIAMLCVQFRGAAAEAAAKFRREAGELRRIFDFIGDFFAARAISEAARRSIELAAEEIFMNYIRHNVAGKTEVEIRMRLDGDQLRVDLTDFAAPPFDVEHAPKPDVDQPLANRRPGGLGISLAKSMVDRLEYRHEDGNSIVTLLKRVKLNA